MANAAPRCCRFVVCSAVVFVVCLHAAFSAKHESTPLVGLDDNLMDLDSTEGVVKKQKAREELKFRRVI
eukprot:365289-Chlamydomonas_euryale.AAC.3